MRKTFDIGIHPKNVATGLLFVALGVGCADERADLQDEAPAEDTSELQQNLKSNVSDLDQSEPLTTLELPNSGTIKFYEPEPGTILVVELGKAEALAERESMPPDATAAERYERLAGRAAPQALVDADSRSAALRAGRRTPRPEEPEVVPAAAPQVRQKALSNDKTHTQFVNTFCTVYGTYWNWVWVTGSGSIGQKNDRHWIDAAALAVYGSIHHTVKRRPWYTWKNMANLNVPQGWYSYVTYTDYGTDFDVQASVSEADGDTYDMCTHISS